MTITKDELQRIKVNMQGNLTITTLFRLIETIEQAWAKIACHEQGILTLSRTVEGLTKERDALKAKVGELEREQRRLAVGRGIGALHEIT